MNQCIRDPGVTCPQVDCPGRSIARACQIVAGVQLGTPSSTPPRRKSPDGRVRVGLLCPCLVLGGAEAHQLALARYTDSAKIEWRGCAVVGEHHRVSPEMLAATSELMPVSVGPAAARQLASECDVLVSWAIDGLDRLVGGMARPPKVISVVHAPVESQWGRTVYARTRGVDHWVAVSELALEALPESSRSVPSSVIWNAVDLDRLQVTRDRQAMRRLWGVPDDALVAGYLGRLSEEKDPQAMARLASHLPEPWRVVVVGDGPIPVVGPANLILAGPDRGAGDVLNAFDVLVIPSHYESFCLTMAEGLVKGVPIVSTDSGIAKLAPGITTPIPVNAEGPAIAAAVSAAHARRSPRPGTDLADRGDGVWAEVGPPYFLDVGKIPEPDPRREILPRLHPVRFGAEWSELICSLAPIDTPAPTPYRPAIDPSVRDAVNSCVNRGPVLPISMQGDCGCGGGKELSECRAGRGKFPGRVTLRDCLSCKAG